MTFHLKVRSSIPYLILNTLKQLVNMTFSLKRINMLMQNSKFIVYLVNACVIFNRNQLDTKVKILKLKNVI